MKNRAISVPSRHLNHNVSLAALTAAEQAHETKLRQHLAARMAAHYGSLSFAEFMSAALYTPGLGYYSAGAHKLGAGGDFTTAPEISPLFGRALARQIADVLGVTGGAILELGAGTGAMAAQILAELARCDALPERYCILEVSAELRQRQRQHLEAHAAEWLARVQWLEQLPVQFTGCVVANEVLDALPVERFVIHDGEVMQQRVRLEAGQFVWQSALADAPLRNAVRHIEQELNRRLPEGYTSEVNLALPDWLQALAEGMQRGAMLWIDYGAARPDYYAVTRTQGTLACFHRHRMHDDPLVSVGLQDITAWVDFTALAEAGLAAGLQLAGFATQAHFLFGCGLQELVGDLAAVPDEQRWRVSQQVQQLTLPGEMGEVFKVMALTKDCDLAWRGFAFRDLRERL